MRNLGLIYKIDLPTFSHHKKRMCAQRGTCCLLTPKKGENINSKSLQSSNFWEKLRLENRLIPQLESWPQQNESGAAKGGTVHGWLIQWECLELSLWESWGELVVIDTMGNDIGRISQLTVLKCQICMTSASVDMYCSLCAASFLFRRLKWCIDFLLFMIHHFSSSTSIITEHHLCGFPVFTTPNR